MPQTHSHFEPLEQSDFQRLKYGASLKGLLKALKGKGDLELLSNECESLRDALITLAPRILAQAISPPFSLLPAALSLQSTSANTMFLRWRATDRSAMGVSVWVKLMEDPGTPASLLHDLYLMELQRITLNMQISLTHTIARQAAECSAKARAAETVYLRRIHGDRLHNADARTKS